MKRSLVVISLIWVVLLLASCAQTLESSEESLRGQEKGGTPITIHLLYAPKNIDYKSGQATVQDKVLAGGYLYDSNSTVQTTVYQPSVWAWQVISSGNTNYTNRDWPGDLLMEPFDKDGRRLDGFSNGVEATATDNDKRYLIGDGVTTPYQYKADELTAHQSEIAEWRLTLRVSTKNPLGVLFVDTHVVTKKDGSDQYSWEQTNDVQIDKEKLKKGAHLYFIYGTQAYSTNYEGSLGIKSAKMTASDGSQIEVTLYGEEDANLTPSNFIVTDRDGTIAEDGTVTGTSLTVGSVSDKSDTGAVLGVTGGSNKMPFKIWHKKTIGGKTIITGPVYAYMASDVIDDAGIIYEGEDLGLTYGNGKAKFLTWAPTAESVSLLLFSTSRSTGVKSSNPNYWEKEPAEPGDDSNSCRKFTMERNDYDSTGSQKWDGTWIYECDTTDLSSYKYYKYRITFSDKKIDAATKKILGSMKADDEKKFKWTNTIEAKRYINDEITYDVPDLWGTVYSADSTATQLIDINDESLSREWEAQYTNPWTKNDQDRPYSDAVLYEMNVADWGRDCGGKFETLGDSDVIDHLRDMGITHVVLMPIEDYVYTNADSRYNWGFCTFNFNGIEGRYVVDMADGGDGVIQLRRLIKKFHDAGIAVIMDVAYTHTGNNKVGVGNESIYDSTVPEYFYRLVDGVYSNGTNQGCEVASSRKMVKKFMIESLKHWMNDFHINGFSFYLMGLHEKDTMEEIYNELKKIDSNVLIYGEPWTGGRREAIEEDDAVRSAVKILSNGNGLAVLDVNFREAVKGKELRGFTRGQVQGNYRDDLLNAGLIVKNVDKVDEATMTNTTGSQALSIHYCEIHDDNTLFDKLLLSNDMDAGTGSYKENTTPLFSELYESLDDYIEGVKAEDKLAAAYVILSQGTPFISGGQEFLRTKKGNGDSSEAGIRREYSWPESKVKECNAIDRTMISTYNDVLCTYRGLIALRQDNLKSFSNNTNATAVSIRPGLTKYTAGDFVIIFNATDTTQTLSDIRGKVVDVTGGISLSGVDSAMIHTFWGSVKPYTTAESAAPVTSVGAKSFVIIDKR